MTEPETLPRVELENSTVIHGDCFQAFQEIDEQSIDMVLVNPPYGTTACDWDTVLDLDLIWAGLDRICRAKTPILQFAAQPFTSILGASNVSNLRYSYVWKKSRPTGHLNAKKDQ